MTNGRGPQRLNLNQRAALDWVHETDERWRQAKRNARIEAQRLVEEKIALHALERDKAVLEAANLDVPKSRIGREGLGTTSPNAVYEILNRMTAAMELSDVALAVKALPKFSWSDSEFIEVDNGATYELRWLLASDGFQNASEDVAGMFTIPAHEGYLYVRTDRAPTWMAYGEKAPAEALAWAEVNS